MWATGSIITATHVIGRNRFQAETVRDQTIAFLTTCCINFYCTFAYVKWWTTFLAFYLLCLSLWPCADEFPPIMGQGQRGYVVLAADSLSQPGQPHEQHDQCTPFCTCACCAATITVIPRFSYSLAPSSEAPSIAVAAFQYISLDWSAPLSAIWQPPQLRV